ncbi:MAG: hypothetical protein KC912_22725 [Proteobacteria bacterium]|nr:hypothetical protein [Pseudomonadota bacterium]
MGLWHSNELGATMNPAMNGHPDGRSLESDDLEGLCALYANTSGDGEFGETCADESNCDDSLICLLDGAEQYCTQTCPGGGCPDGYDCVDAGGERVCAKALTSGCGCHTGGGALGLMWLPALLVWGRRRSGPPGNGD